MINPLPKLFEPDWHISILPYPFPLETGILLEVHLFKTCSQTSSISQAVPWTMGFYHQIKRT